MPIKKAAHKALRQTQKATIINRAVKTSLKKTVKNARASIAAGKEDIASNLALAIRTLDRAAKKGVIKKNKAARLKSRLMKASHRVTKK